MNTLRINWRWLRGRLAFWRCRHVWFDGDRAGNQACRKCGIWRWFPVLPPRIRPAAPSEGSE